MRKTGTSNEQMSHPIPSQNAQTLMNFFLNLNADDIGEYLRKYCTLGWAVFLKSQKGQCLGYVRPL